MPDPACSCTFEFERPEMVFYSGEIIKGRVVLNTTKVFTLSELTIQCDGIGEVCWEEEVKENDKLKYKIEYRSRETYVENLTVIRRRFKLRPGRETYYFSIQLPEGCASSFEQKYGHVSYVLTLKMAPFNICFQQPITVLEKVDLNLDSQNAIPVKAEEVKYFCCLFCSSGPVQLTLTLPYSGYVPGQKIAYQLEMDNQSQYDLSGYEVKLVQYSKFHASYPEPENREIWVSLAREESDQRCFRLSKRLFNRELTVPFAPSTSESRHIISISYYFEITIRSGSCHFDIELKVPIAIGTIPLTESLNDGENGIVTGHEVGNQMWNECSNDEEDDEEYDSNLDAGDGWVDCDDDENRDVDDGVDVDEDGGENIEVSETDPLNSPQPEPSAPEYNDVADNPPSYENCMPPTFEQATISPSLLKSTNIKQ